MPWYEAQGLSDLTTCAGANSRRQTPVSNATDFTGERRNVLEQSRARVLNLV